MRFVLLLCLLSTPALAADPAPNALPQSMKGIPKMHWEWCANFYGPRISEYLADVESVGMKFDARQRACIEAFVMADCGTALQKLAAKNNGLDYPNLAGAWCAEDFEPAMKQTLREQCLAKNLVNREWRDLVKSTAESIVDESVKAFRRAIAPRGKN